MSEQKTDKPFIPRRSPRLVEREKKKAEKAAKEDEISLSSDSSDDTSDTVDISSDSDETSDDSSDTLEDTTTSDSSFEVESPDEPKPSEPKPTPEPKASEPTPEQPPHEPNEDTISLDEPEQPSDKPTEPDKSEPRRSERERKPVIRSDFVDTEKAVAGPNNEIDLNDLKDETYKDPSEPPEQENPQEPYQEQENKQPLATLDPKAPIVLLTPEQTARLEELAENGIDFKTEEDVRNAAGIAIGDDGYSYLDYYRHLRFPDQSNQMATVIPYPFKSKAKVYSKMIGKEVDVKVAPKDIHLKALEEVKRPTYSPKPHAYQMDIMFTKNRQFLVLINTNTRYLFVEPIANKSTKEVQRVINNLLDHGVQIDYLSGDAEPAFIGMRNRAFDAGDDPLNRHDIEMRFIANPYTFHNKIVDAAIRTLRNAAAYDESVLENDNLREQIVNYYNNTPHNGLHTNKEGRHYTPAEVQNDIDLEWEYIRSKDRELAEVAEQFSERGLDRYRPGNVLAIYMDRSKTKERFRKRRRNLEDIGIFIEYHNGNPYVYVLTKQKYSEVPLFYTVKLADSLETLEQKYIDYYNIAPQVESFLMGGV